MKNNRGLHFSYPLMVYGSIGLAIFLMAFSVVPMTGVIDRAAGTANADIKVLGTSNVHNWSMEDKDVSCTAKFTYGAGKTSMPGGLAAFSFTFPVHSLKSGESGMDSKAYGAMYPDEKLYDQDRAV
jgi:hypothetical protein